MADTFDDWRRALTAADALRTSGLLDWITEDDVFAVEDPATSEVGFVAVSHHDDAEQAHVMLLLGPDALRVHESIQWHFFVDQTDLRTRQNAVTVTYDDREERHEVTQRLIDDLGMAFDDDIAPSLARFEPGVFPHYPSGDDVRRAADAFEQALVAFARLQEDDEAFERDGEMLVRCMKDGEWHDDWRAIDTLTAPTPSEWFDPPQDLVARIATVGEAKGVWEYGAMYAPVPFDPDAGPQLACIHLITDTSGRTFNEGVGPRLDARGMCEFLVAAIEKAARRPVTLQIADDELAAAVAGLAAQSGIELQVVDHLDYIGADYETLLKPLRET